MEEKRIAKNGIEIYGYKNEALHGFFISLFLRGGSMYESEKDNGITHFFEHIAIRNVNKLMDGRLYAELDKHGVEFNASTFAEMVQFYVSGASANFKFASEVLTKVLSPIVISKSECDSERKRIKAEIRESDDRNSLSAFSNENKGHITIMNTPTLYNDCAYTLISAEEISAMVDRLAAEIQAVYQNSQHRLIMVVILKGSVPFAADLMKRLSIPLELEFMKVSSYGAGA